MSGEVVLAVMAISLVCLVALVGSGAHMCALPQALYAQASRAGERQRRKERAQALLREVLTAEEYRQLTRCGHLQVDSPTIMQRIYRIPATGGQVQVYEQGVEVMSLCLQSVEPLPLSEVIVLHKLMIQGNEEECLATANHFTPLIAYRRR